mmetsp:Transcript_14022/g.30091  ORF Transcript_14022/g.30091 Transcript_14022/m.30091 type:complete len:251 (-) Transcript_14022:1580-2332(-)
MLSLHFPQQQRRIHRQQFMIPMMSRRPIIVSRQTPHTKGVSIHFRNHRRIKTVIFLRRRPIHPLLQEMCAIMKHRPSHDIGIKTSPSRAYPLSPKRTLLPLQPSVIPPFPVLGHEEHEIPRLHAQIKYAERDDERRPDPADGVESPPERHVDTEGIAVFHGHARGGPAGVRRDHDPFSRSSPMRLPFPSVLLSRRPRRSPKSDSKTPDSARPPRRRSESPSPAPRAGPRRGEVPEPSPRRIPSGRGATCP